MTPTSDPIADARARLLALGCEPLDVAILQPAEPFLDLAGEELRARVLLTEDEAGHLMCLRPEFTIPAARLYLAEGRTNAARYACAGSVFRQRRGEPSEFLQAGIESIGASEGSDGPEADARAIADALALLDGTASGRTAAIVMGDQAIFEAVTRALGLPETWTRRLARLFGDEARLARALDGLTGREAVDVDAPETRLGAPHALPEGVASALADPDANALEAAIDAAIEKARMGLGARDGRAIAARLRAARELAGTRLGEAEGAALRAFLALDLPLDGVTDALHALDLPRANGAFAAALDRHEKRLRALAARGVDPARIRFRGAFGRPLDYYTGLVFEMRDERGTVLAGGGRYDRLLAMLDRTGRLGGRSVPAIGFAVWLDRLGGAS